MELNSSYFKNRLGASASASASGNSLGTLGTVKVPVPGSVSQNLHAMLYSICVCI